MLILFVRASRCSEFQSKAEALQRGNNNDLALANATYEKEVQTLKKKVFTRVCTSSVLHTLSLSLSLVHVCTQIHLLCVCVCMYGYDSVREQTNK